MGGPTLAGGGTVSATSARDCHVGGTDPCNNGAEATQDACHLNAAECQKAACGGTWCGGANNDGGASDSSRRRAAGGGASGTTGTVFVGAAHRNGGILAALVASGMLA